MRLKQRERKLYNKIENELNSHISLWYSYSFVSLLVCTNHNALFSDLSASSSSIINLSWNLNIYVRSILSNFWIKPAESVFYGRVKKKERKIDVKRCSENNCIQIAPVYIHIFNYITCCDLQTEVINHRHRRKNWNTVWNSSTVTKIYKTELQFNELWPRQ